MSTYLLWPAKWPNSHFVLTDGMKRPKRRYHVVPGHHSDIKGARSEDRRVYSNVEFHQPQWISAHEARVLVKFLDGQLTNETMLFAAETLGTRLRRVNPTIATSTDTWHIEIEDFMSFCGERSKGVRALWSARPTQQQRVALCRKCIGGFMKHA